MFIEYINIYIYNILMTYIINITLFSIQVNVALTSGQNMNISGQEKKRM